MKIICIENNYSDDKNEPLLSLKPETALLRKNHPFYIPEFSNDIRCEVGILLKSCKNGRHISEKFADTYFQELALAVNFVAYDVLVNNLQKQLPTDIARGFDFSMSVSDFINKENFSKKKSIDFRLDVNGKTLITGNTSEMKYSFNTSISFFSKYFFLKMGDFIFTGGKKSDYQLQIGDHLEAFILEEKALNCLIK